MGDLEHQSIKDHIGYLKLGDGISPPKLKEVEFDSESHKISGSEMDILKLKARIRLYNLKQELKGELKRQALSFLIQLLDKKIR